MRARRGVSLEPAIRAEAGAIHMPPLDPKELQLQQLQLHSVAFVHHWFMKLARSGTQCWLKDVALEETWEEPDQPTRAVFGCCFV